MVDVVACILLKDRKFLVERRRSDDPADAGFVCIPGGHVDKDESLEEALKREMREELNIIVKKAEMIFKDIYIASNGERQTCYYFHITGWSGNPSSDEATEIFWETDLNKLTVDIDRRAVKVVLKKSSRI